MLNSTLHLTTLHLSTEPSEPANTIKTYLKVSLNSKQPCIYIQDQKLKDLQLNLSFRESPHDPSYPIQD